MNTYYLGTIPVTDELYHMIDGGTTFGRMDQNELWHYGIKGQSWGKRRFQNEDGSLTAAGRARYDVGAPLLGSTNQEMANRRNYATQPKGTTSGGYGGGGGTVTKKATPTISQATKDRFKSNVTNRVTTTTNVGKKAADNIFGRIGNWAGNAAKDVGNAATGAYNSAKNWTGQAVKDVGNAAKDVGNFATNAYNDASKAVTGAAKDVGNWAGNAAKDVGNFATNAYNDASKAVGNAAKDVGNWGNQAIKDIGQTTNNVSNAVSGAAKDVGNFATNVYNDASKAVGNAAKDVGNFATNAYNDASKAVTGAAKDVGNWAGNAAKDVGNAVSGAVKDAGDWTNNAASDVADWGKGAVETGKNFFNNLFGKSEAPEATLSDPNQRVETEKIIPEQRITEETIPEIQEKHDRAVEQKPTVNGSNNVQTWDNANINTWDNVQTFGDPDMVNTIKLLNDNGFFNRGGPQNNSSSDTTLFDKPDNVSDEYWRDYKFNGGTREAYDQQMNNMRSNQSKKSQDTTLSDKPDGVSDEYWRDYKFNGGTREAYDRQMNNLRTNTKTSQPINQNGSQKPTVDTSRPYHFTYDPQSGQTIVVYDDEKRR